MGSFVTVVSGLPRSGTSLMMQMLAAGGYPVLTDSVRQPDADNPQGYFELDAVKQTARDAGWVKAAQGKAVKVVYALLRDLPGACDYRVIMMHRDIGEVVASQRAMLERSGREGASIPLDQLAELLARELRSAEEWVALQRNFRLLRAAYLDCIERPGWVAAEVSRFLDASLDDQLMKEAVTSELYRQRRPRGGGPPG